MKPDDLRVLCVALGFTAMTLSNEKLPPTEGAARAAGFARLIEAFCRDTVPEAFALIENKKTALKNTAEKFSTAHRMADTIVHACRGKGECWPQDLRGEGFTQTDIDKHWPMAKALANVEMKIFDA